MFQLIIVLLKNEGVIIKHTCSIIIFKPCHLSFVFIDGPQSKIEKQEPVGEIKGSSHCNIL